MSSRSSARVFWGKGNINVLSCNLNLEECLKFFPPLSLSLTRCCVVAYLKCHHQPSLFLSFFKWISIFFLEKSGSQSSSSSLRCCCSPPLLKIRFFSSALLPVAYITFGSAGNAATISRVCLRLCVVRSILSSARKKTPWTNVSLSKYMSVSLHRFERQAGNIHFWYQFSLLFFFVG